MRADKEDEKFMGIALKLAEKGEGYTSPNPMVGALIVKEGKIIGEGYHQIYGGPHAERNAIANCLLQGESPMAATMYVTLEPCCHYGKTPPCTEAIIENHIGRVVVGCVDPNVQMAGKGIDALEKAGISVKLGVLEEECRELNKIFFHYIQTKTPYVAMKYAMTLDGKIAAYTGKSKWITGEEAREHVHKLRHKYQGIMTGIGTVLEDDPMLNCRLPEESNPKNPKRIICDTNLRIPLDCQIVKTAKDIETYIATASADGEKAEKLRERGCKILRVAKRENHIDLKELMMGLGKEGIDSVILEGGGTLNYEALQRGIVDHVYAYIAPKLLGGKDAKTPLEGQGRESPKEAFNLIKRKMTILGDDILLEYQVDNTQEK